jgi:hypothetical protein
MMAPLKGIQSILPKTVHEWVSVESISVASFGGSATGVSRSARRRSRGRRKRSFLAVVRQPI